MQRADNMTPLTSLRNDLSCGPPAAGELVIILEKGQRVLVTNKINVSDTTSIPNIACYDRFQIINKYRTATIALDFMP